MLEGHKKSGPLYEGLFLLLLNRLGRRSAFGTAGERLIFGRFASALKYFAATSLERALVSLNGGSTGLDSDFGWSTVFALRLLSFIVLGVRSSGQQYRCQHAS
jgi:hypothetical protein